MNRQAPYADASGNRYATSQMSTQRMQQNSQINDFSGQPQFQYRPDARQQWDTNPQIELNQMSPHSYSQGHKGNMIRSQERMGNQKVNYENQANNINNQRIQSHEQDMEIGYEEKTRSELTFEGLEQRFQDEMMKLMKEVNNAEDAENARHRERIVEINTRYEENLCSVRIQHASRVGEFLRKESQTRLQHYQQGANAMNERGPPDYGGGMGPEARRAYGGIPDESYRERTQYREGMRNQGYEGRVAYPHGRVYNNNSSDRY